MFVKLKSSYTNYGKHIIPMLTEKKSVCSTKLRPVMDVACLPVTDAACLDANGG